jgi:hypothetical protein
MLQLAEAQTQALQLLQLLVKQLLIHTLEFKLHGLLALVKL